MMSFDGENVKIDLNHLEETDIELGIRSRKQLDALIDRDKNLHIQHDVKLTPGKIYRILEGDCKDHLVIYYRDAVLVFQLGGIN